MIRTLALGVFLTTCFAASALGQETPESTDALKERVAKQDETIELLKQRLERLEEGAGLPADPTAPETPPEPRDPHPVGEEGDAAEEPTEEAHWTDRIELGMFYVEDKKRAWKVEVRGRLHSDGRFIADRGHDDFDNGFQIRRARIEFRAKIYDRVSFDLGIEAGRTSDADLRNAYVTLKLHDSLRIRTGQMLLPYSTERLTSSKFLRHPERSILVASMVGQRDIGALVHGSLFGGHAYYMAGIFNGNGQNRRVDLDDDLDLAARFEVRPFADDDFRITLNYIHTPEDRSQTGPDDLRTVGNEFSRFLDYDTANNRRRGRRQRAGGGVLFSHGPFEFTGEVNADYHEDMRSTTERRTNLLNWSWFVGATWVMTGETLQQRHDGPRVDPASPFYDPQTEEMGLGAFQLSLRYEDVLIDRETIRKGFATGTDRVRALATSLHWYPWKELRFTLNYTYSNFGDRVTDSKGRRHNDDHAILCRMGFWF